MAENDRLATRGEGVPGSDHGDLPRRPSSPSDRLLRMLVIAWDLDDEAAFEQTLAKARVHIGVMGVLPRPSNQRRES